MQYQVTEAQYTELNEEQQALYGKASDGKHTFKVEGLPDYTAQEARITAMDSKIADLLTETKAAKQAKKDAEKEATKKAEAAAQKSGDVDAINASWQTKYDDGIAGLTGERDDALSMLRLEKVHSKAVELATTLAVPGSADVLLPHIESRLSMDIVDGRAVAVVKDTAGKPSALTVEELGKEIANNAAFAPLIVASNAAGGGANGTTSGGAAQNKTASRDEFGSWNPNQKQKFFSEGGTLTE